MDVVTSGKLTYWHTLSHFAILLESEALYYFLLLQTTIRQLMPIYCGTLKQSKKSNFSTSKPQLSFFFNVTNAFDLLSIYVIVHFHPTQLILVFVMKGHKGLFFVLFFFMDLFFSMRDVIYGDCIEFCCVEKKMLKRVFSYQI